MDVLAALRTAAPSVFDPEPVLFAYLFGSHARGTADHLSDVDIAIFVDEEVPEDRYLDLSLRLAGDLQRASRAKPIEALVVLNQAPLPLAGRVVKDGKVIYSRDEPRRVRYESLTFREFADYQIVMRGFEEERLRAHAEGRR